MSQPSKNRRTAHNILRFSGLAFQLAILIALAVWGGGKLDSYMNNSTKYMTALCVVIAFTGFMIALFRDLRNIK